MKIADIKAREILDSRGNPTVEVDVMSRAGAFGRAAVPSGASTGSREAKEIRDHDLRMDGKGVRVAVENIVTTITPEIQKRQPGTQIELDELLIELDGTEDKSRLGANALLGVSLAYAKARAHEAQQPLFQHIHSLHNSQKSMRLPLPMINIFNGGAHASGSTSIQEFMLIPHAADDFRQALEAGAEIFHQLGRNLKKKGYSTAVGDEGGYAPAITSDSQAIELLIDAIEDAGYRPGGEVSLGLDVAASEFYQDESYDIDDQSLTDQEMLQWLKDLTEKYPIISIEDGLDENDWSGWAKMQKTLGKHIQLVGDDLLVTNEKYLTQAIADKSANAILIKPNQIGTLSETLHTIEIAQNAGWECIISHRSGETADTTIAHIAVGTGATQIKTGSMSRGERTEKYNELLRISELLDSTAIAQPFKIFQSR